MRNDYSFGIIPIRYFGGRSLSDLKVCLIKHVNGGHWSFPKGHSDEGEGPQHAAERELVEETGLAIESFFPKVFHEHYEFVQGEETISKEVVYFLAEVSGEVHVDPEEISEFVWVSFTEGAKKLTHPGSEKILRDALEFLKAY